jgi:hypothetical protein
MTNAHSETGQMAVCCQNLMLGGLSSRSALSLLVGALFKKFGLLFEDTSYVRNIGCYCPLRTDSFLLVKINMPDITRRSQTKFFL